MVQRSTQRWLSMAGNSLLPKSEACGRRCNFYKKWVRNPLIQVTVWSRISILPPPHEDHPDTNDKDVFTHFFHHLTIRNTMKPSTIFSIALGLSASAVATPARNSDGLSIFEARGVNVIRQGCVSLPPFMLPKVLRQFRY